MALKIELFVRQLVDSRLMTAKEIDAFLKWLPPQRQPKDGQALARELVRAERLTKYQAQMVYQAKIKGLVLGEYVIREPLGEGGMGVVFKAYHRRMRRVVAVKLPSAETLKSREARHRFIHEVRAAAKLTHPNIVAAYDAREDNGISYLVMEYVDGQNLAQIVKELGRMPVIQAVQCILQSARGLQYAHAHGVIHRDIKPANLLVDSEGTVKILDMGLSRVEQVAGVNDPTCSEPLTRSGQLLGTCQYMAPEQGQDMRAVDQRSDIYALGCTLFHLLTGKPPFMRPTTIEVVLAHRNDPAPSLCKVRDDVPLALDEIFQKMVAKRPDDRYQSTEELIVDLEDIGRVPGDFSTDSRFSSFIREVTQNAEAHAHSSEQPDTLSLSHGRLRAIGGSGVWGKVSRKRAILSAAGVGVVVLLVGLGWWLASSSGRPASTPRTPLAAGPSPVAPKEIPSPFEGVRPIETPEQSMQRKSTAESASKPKSSDPTPVVTPKTDTPKANSPETQSPKTAAKPVSPPVSAPAPPAVEHHAQIPPAPVVGPAAPAAEMPKAKHAVPAEAIQKDLRRQLAEAYDLDRVRSSAEKLKLIKDLQDLAGKSKSEAEQYVLLHRAMDLASEAGDASLMLAIADRLAVDFDIQALAFKEEQLGRFAEEATDLSRVRSTIKASRELQEEAIRAERYDMAVSLATKAYRLGQKTFARDYRKETLDRKVELEKLQQRWQKIEESLAVIKQTPDDPTANLAVGRWYSVKRGDWDKGLPYLARSGDTHWQPLAKQEVQHLPTQPDDQVKLADGWWDLAQSLPPKDKPDVLVRSGAWYREALPNLASAIAKTKVEKRLAEIAKLDRPLPIIKFPMPEPPPAIAPFDQKKAKEHQALWAKYLGVPVEMTNSIGMKFVLIPPGEFDMGATPEEIAWAEEEAKKRPDGFSGFPYLSGPQHRTRLTRPFYLGVYKVTQAEYEHVMKVNPSSFAATPMDASLFQPPLTSREKEIRERNVKTVAGVDTHRYPVNMVSWNECVEYCRRLSALPEESAAGRSYQLPSEAQWEHACRAGTTSRWFFGDDPAKFEDYAWYRGSSAMHPVGQKNPNPWGVYDLYGLVREYCADAFLNYSPEPLVQVDPSIPEGHGPKKVTRGTSNQPPSVCRSSTRSMTLPDDHVEGVRVVCEIPAFKHSATGFASGVPTRVVGGRDAAVQRISNIDSAGNWRLPADAPPPAVAPFSADQAKALQERWASYLGKPVEITNSIGMKFVLIPPGEFDMGSTPEEVAVAVEKIKEEPVPLSRRCPSETPRHRVKISRPFYLGIYPVTQSEYEQVTGVNPNCFTSRQMEATLFRPSLGETQLQQRDRAAKKIGKQDTSRYPVETVNWDECAEFCRKLSAMSGERAARSVYHLPTEAQWEYACRAGTTTPWYHGDDPKLLREAAWFKDNWNGMPHPVGQKRPNAWSLYDMLGNIGQRCSDASTDDYYQKSPLVDPVGPASGEDCVIRGGSWERGAYCCRPAMRISAPRQSRSYADGFRAVLMITP
jgi:formylglycine-generating enzyme required for sulfatase activity/serine/threonine protein kinase